MPAELVVLDPLATLEQDLATTPTMFPGEDPGLYEAMREALLRDLSPRSAYERHLANSLIMLEWEAYRHRSFRDETIRTRARDLAVGAFETGKPRLVGRASDTSTALGQALLGWDRDAATEAEAVLWEKHEILPTAIVAQAYNDVSHDVEMHERKVADLEKRRQRLKEDYDRLRAVRRPAVEDAEILG